MNEKFTKIKNELIVSNMKDSKFRVLCYLIARSKDGKCFPSIRTIANELGKGKGTIQCIIDELIDEKILQKENRFVGSGKKTSNSYQISEKYLSKKRSSQTDPIELPEPEKLELYDYNWLEDEDDVGDKNENRMF